MIAFINKLSPIMLFHFNNIVLFAVKADDKP